MVRYLNVNFKPIYQAVCNSARNRATRIDLNCYDTPVAPEAPVIEGISGPWLYTAFVNNGISPALWAGVTQILFATIRETIEGWGKGRPQIVVVKTSGRLDSAGPGAQGDSGDWINEIHRNQAGWKKQADVWRAVLS